MYSHNNENIILVVILKYLCKTKRIRDKKYFSLEWNKTNQFIIQIIDFLATWRLNDWIFNLVSWYENKIAEYFISIV